MIVLRAISMPGQALGHARSLEWDHLQFELFSLSGAADAISAKPARRRWSALPQGAVLQA